MRIISSALAHMDFRPVSFKVQIVHIRLHQLDAAPVFGNGVRCDAVTRYLFEVNSRWTIDGANRKNRARYINHSCRPNAEVYFVGHVIKIRAIKNIKPDEEITYNYGRGYFDCFIKAVGCKCVACRKKEAKARAERRKSLARAKKRAAARKK